MNRSQRIIAFSLIAILLLTGFAIGRFTGSSDKVAAEETAKVAGSVDTQPAPVNEASAPESKFYLSDYKVGYNEGFKAARKGENGAFPETTRAGYNDGYKEGYGDALQNEAEGEATEPVARQAVVTRAPAQRTVYRTVTRPVYVQQQRRGSSKFRKALTIAAPAAIGAGIGAMFGGKKGAGIGALLGGGGGAAYLLTRKRRN